MCLVVETIFILQIFQSQELQKPFAVSGGGGVAGAVQEMCMRVCRFVEDSSGECGVVWMDGD